MICNNASEMSMQFDQKTQQIKREMLRPSQAQAQITLYRLQLITFQDTQREINEQVYPRLKVQYVKKDSKKTQQYKSFTTPYGISKNSILKKPNSSLFKRSNQVSGMRRNNINNLSSSLTFQTYTQGSSMSTNPDTLQSSELKKNGLNLVNKATKDNHDIHRSIGTYLETDENEKDSVSNSSSDTVSVDQAQSYDLFKANDDAPEYVNLLESNTNQKGKPGLRLHYSELKQIKEEELISRENSCSTTHLEEGTSNDDKILRKAYYRSEKGFQTKSKVILIVVDLKL
ncbi:UNKNOWN [Stylonychia lemnae]|uniref:Uncharacterized protein n=1 Tax=Stylonychia lemnae TaxID=5949 RepID=A0A078AFD9_STYLE|nr:UNKNOWN [Stylonychia lemnae]|eukprot:CDW80242.1 UNKNOWN [Stylonychia lemnae]